MWDIGSPRIVSGDDYRTDDVDAAAQNATELGAAVVMPKQVLPDGDEMAIIHDSFGITFGLWRKGLASDPE